MAKRRLEKVQGKSAKFWEVSVSKNFVSVQFGRLGTEGQTRQWEYASARDAKEDAEAMTAAKLASGYMERTAGRSSAARSPSRTASGKAKTRSSPQGSEMPPEGLTETVVSKLKDLGARLPRAKGKRQVTLSQIGSFYSFKTSKSWEGRDPHGKVETVPAALQELFSLEWKKGTKLEIDAWGDGDYRDFEWCRQSENADRDDVKPRRVLVSFAWEPISQFMYCVDLLDTSSDPWVYKVDHDGSDFSPKARERLSRLLGSIRS